MKHRALRSRVAHAVAGERPLLEGGARVEATMGSVVVLALDPRPEASVERLEALGVFVPEVAEPSGAQGSEKPFDFSLIVGRRMQITVLRRYSRLMLWR